jgi:hypothetical protein
MHSSGVFCTITYVCCCFFAIAVLVAVAYKRNGRHSLLFPLLSFASTAIPVLSFLLSLLLHIRLPSSLLVPQSLIFYNFLNRALYLLFILHVPSLFTVTFAPLTTTCIYFFTFSTFNALFFFTTLTRLTMTHLSDVSYIQRGVSMSWFYGWFIIYVFRWDRFEALRPRRLLRLELRSMVTALTLLALALELA